MESQLEILFESADRFFRSGNLLESLFCYRDILQSREVNNKGLELAFWGAGESLMNLGLHYEALSYLKEAVRYNDRDYNYYYLLAECYLKLLQPQEAQKYLNQSLNLKPDHPELLRCLGWSYILEKKNQQGISLLKKSLELESNNLRTLCDLAVAYMNNHNYRESQKVIDRAKKLDPQDPMILDVEAANRHFAQLYRQFSKKAGLKTRPNSAKDGPIIIQPGLPPAYHP